MTVIGLGQILLTLALTFACAVPLGGYVARAMSGDRSALSSVLRPVERLLYAVLRLQYWLPFNPQGFAGMSPRLALNTAMSFVTNTNWQAYAGESALSNGAQMFGLTVHNFLSAASGIAAAAAVSRAFVAGNVRTLGNFWADLVRATLYILLPLAFAVSVA